MSNNNPNDQPVYISVNEAARILHVSLMTVYRLVNEGAFESLRFGRTIRINRASFDAWRAANTTAPGPRVLSEDATAQGTPAAEED